MDAARADGCLRRGSGSGCGGERFPFPLPCVCRDGGKRKWETASLARRGVAAGAFADRSVGAQGSEDSAQSLSANAAALAQLAERERSGGGGDGLVDAFGRSGDLTGSAQIGRLLLGVDDLECERAAGGGKASERSSPQAEARCSMPSRRRSR